MPDLMEHQIKAVDQLKNGNILYGGVGSGKTRVAFAHYDKREKPRDIYVITTARKRDSLDWEDEASRWGIGTEVSTNGLLFVDSWNNIGKYVGIRDAFFIFDEQRVVGTGAWVQYFLAITKVNHWILLSATPGDTWLDYAPVFIANGFYKNISDFRERHVVYERFVKYPKVKMYIREERLEELRNQILVEMNHGLEDRRILNWWPVGYDADRFAQVQKKRWNVYEGKPIKDVAEMFRLMRKVVNSDPSRLDEVVHLNQLHPRLIVFYNFDYELEDLRLLAFHCPTYEWNGHRKHPLGSFEKQERWIYLVQYVAGAEAWNCTSTDAVILYSLTYSYKNFEQAQGRIDRMDSPFEKLYYYVFVSNSFIDRAIRRSLEHKENFNERKAALQMVREGGEIDAELEAMNERLEAKYRADPDGHFEGCEI